ncbi:MAG: GNAT family N-acetyltransferase [Defluviitaleaceae bacterium]|nr:GNAT family N-acetyltransferase [Defluviitaleaceae bacterium]
MLEHSTLLDKGFSFTRVVEDGLPGYLIVKKNCYEKYVDEYFGGWVNGVQLELNTEAFKRLLGKDDFIRISLHGETVGFYSFDVLDDRIDGITIQMIKMAQGMGVGSLYLRHIVNLSHETNKPIYLKVFKSNPAVKLYERFGFVIYDGTASHYLMKFNPSCEGVNQ